jgi:hypothetical protein
VLYAPFDGTVAKIVGEVGEYSTPSPPGVQTPPAIDLIDDSCLYIKAPMDEVDAPKISAGQPVRISLDALPKQSFAGQGQACRPLCFGCREAGTHRRHRSHVGQPGITRQTARRLQRRRGSGPRRARRRRARAHLGATRRRARTGRRQPTANSKNASQDRTGELGVHRGAGRSVVPANVSSPRWNAKASRPAVNCCSDDKSGKMMATPLIALAGIERVFQLGDSARCTPCAT